MKTLTNKRCSPCSSVSKDSSLDVTKGGEYLYRFHRKVEFDTTGENFPQAGVFDARVRVEEDLAIIQEFPPTFGLLGEETNVVVLMEVYPEVRASISVRRTSKRSPGRMDSTLTKGALYGYEGDMCVEGI